VPALLGQQLATVGLFDPGLRGQIQFSAPGVRSRNAAMTSVFSVGKVEQVA